MFTVCDWNIYFGPGAVGVACCDYHVHNGYFGVYFAGGDHRILRYGGEAFGLRRTGKEAKKVIELECKGATWGITVLEDSLKGIG